MIVKATIPMDVMDTLNYVIHCYDLTASVDIVDTFVDDTDTTCYLLKIVCTQSDLDAIERAELIDIV